MAILVTPAATGQLVARSFGRFVLIAILIGIASPVINLYVSYWLNAASGATIVLVEMAIFATVVLGYRVRRPR